MSHQIEPTKTYVTVFASLIGLTLLTTGVAFIDLGPFNTAGHRFLQNAAGDSFLHARAPQRWPGAHCFGRRVFLVGSADGTHDE